MTFIQKIDGNTCGCDSLTGPKSLISVDDALRRISSATRRVTETDCLSLAQASGRVLAQPVVALGMVPPFDSSAMDGYAINTSDLTGDGPWELTLAGRIAAGQARPDPLPAKTAVQIFTGAPVPPGADAVVMQEAVRRTGNRIVLSDRVCRGSHIRKAGEDMHTGRILIPAGRTLTPRDIAVCAAAGHATVTVTRCIRVVLLVTGDEVCQPGQPRGPAGIWDVNTPMLSAALMSPEIELCGVHVAADTRSAARAQLDSLARDVDLIITTGGISVGEEDHVKPAMRDLGTQITFSGVAMKPGKPVSFGRLRDAHWLGLPGNPLSAFVTWQLFGTAVCNALAGRSQGVPQRRHVVTGRTLHHKPGRCELRLARLTGHDGAGLEVVDFPDATHSGRVAPLAKMDGLLFLPADTETLPAGALVEFQPF